MEKPRICDETSPSGACVCALVERDHGGRVGERSKGKNKKRRRSSKVMGLNRCSECSKEKRIGLPISK